MLNTYPMDLTDMIRLSLTVKIIIIITAWSCLWYPISLVFPGNPVLPAATIAPLIGFNDILQIRSWQWPVFQEITLPWLLYWTVLSGMIIMAVIKHNDGMKDNDDDTTPSSP